MLYIRQGATHKVVIGPVVAVANGYVPVTNLAVSSADEAEVVLHDNGTVVDISGYTFAAITTADGYYHLTLQSGISGTVGHMTVCINDDSLCLPVRQDFTVLEEAVYDQLFAASAPGAASASKATQIYSDSTKIESKVVQIYSDTTIIYSDTTIATSKTTQIYSDTAIIYSDTTIATSKTTQIYSDTTIIASKSVQIYSDTTAAAAGTSPDVLVDTTIATLASQTSFTLTAGSADNDVYNGCAAIFTDVSTATQKAIAFISDYVGSTKTVTLEAAPGFTIATTDHVAIMAAGGSTSLPITAALATAEASKLTKVSSKSTQIYSDTTIATSKTTQIYSDTAITSSKAVQIYSDTTKIHSDTTVIEAGGGSLTAAQASQLVRVNSKATQIYSDTTHIDSDTARCESKAVQIYSDTTIIYSDTTIATSKTTQIYSDTTIAVSKSTQIYSDTAITSSKAVQVYSDTTKIHSDTTVLETGVNVAKIATVTVIGAGTSGDKWRG